jgi:tripartite-type tricarboxylate transporter receptor subunit TctC
MAFRSLIAALGCTALACAALAANNAHAQQFPTHAITVIVPNAAGGPNDFLARLMANKLEAKVGQSVIVENRPGGATYTGGAYVARSAPDGYTLLVNAYSGMEPQLFMKGLELNLSRELVPVAPLSEQPFLVYAPTSLPVNDLKEFVAYAKARPGKMNVAIFPGTSSGLEMMDFIKAAGVDALLVPFNSTSAIMVAMLRGDVQLYNGGIGGPKAQIDAGKIRGLAVLGSKRDPQLPNVPTAKELGFDWESAVYYVVFAPAKTPTAIVNQLNEQINAVMHDPDTVARANAGGNPPAPAVTAQEMAARLAKAMAALEKSVRDNHIEPQ